MNDATLFLDALRSLAFSAARLGGVFIIFPMFDARMMTGIARNGVIISLSALVLPLVYRQVPVELGFIPSVFVLAKEVILGALMGFCGAILFWTFEAVGDLIDQQTGSTLSGVVNPMLGEPEGPAGVLMAQVVSVFLLSSGGFLLFLGAIYDSYKVWPIFSYWPSFNVKLEWFAVAQWDTMMDLIMRITAPALVLFLLVEFGLGLLQRYASTLNVFFVSQPIKQLLAVVMLALIITMLGVDAFNGVDITKAVRALFTILKPEGP